MSMRRRKAPESLPVVPSPPGEITIAYEREKQRFLARNGELPYLLVQLQPDRPNKRITLIASFAFSLDREWQQVETHIPIASLQVEAGPEPRFTEAFVQLDDGIGAARIARLFSPLTEEQRIAAGR
jgi:hypothetical protein